MSKACKYLGCEWDVFSNHYCKRHQWCRKDDKWLSKQRESRSKRLSQSKGTKIAPRSKKRLQQDKQYTMLCLEIDAEAIQNKEYKCFFCDEKIEGLADHHHLKGRIGKLLLEKEWIVLGHRDCHRKYHDLPVEKLEEEEWYMEWMKRLYDKDIDLYEKERRKQGR